MIPLIPESVHALPDNAVWCAESASGTARRFGNVQICGLDELHVANADVIVLESDTLSLDRLRFVYHDLAVPVLLIVRPDELTAALTWLRNQDDICQTTDPPSLILRRIQRLIETRREWLDALTGLANRTYFTSVLERHSMQAARQSPVSLILADLDHFKAVNDRYGHAAGGQVLQHCGEMLRSMCDRGQIAARFGGEEFAVMLCDEGLQTRARVLAERVANFITLRSKRLLRDVRTEAETDALTQFYTRRYFDRRMSAELKQFAGRDGQLTVALIDVDHFGQINKVHGWPTGDKILRELSHVIRENLRSTDWVGRYGGEEFCIVMPGTHPQEACIVLERLRANMAATQLVSTAGMPVPVTLSIGVAANDRPDDHPLALLERASAQTLAAKNSGRNRLCYERQINPASPPGR